MRKNSVMTIFVLVLLSTAAALGAPAKATVKSAVHHSSYRSHHIVGTVVSSTGDKLTLKNSKQKEYVFDVTSNTKRPGTIDDGSRVRVTYTDQSGQRIADSVTLLRHAPSSTGAKSATPMTSKPAGLNSMAPANGKAKGSTNSRLK